MSRAKCIDTHTHTYASDGIGDVPDLLRAAESHNLRAVAVTDHDAVEAAQWCYGFMRHVAESGHDESILLVPGVELSSYIVRDGRVDIVHILGLGIDPFSGAMLSACSALRNAHKLEIVDLLARAKELGFPLGCEAEARVIASSSWGRGDIAREEVLARRFDSVEDAYKALWGPRGGEPDLTQYITAGDAIDVIHEANGLAVLAHPLRDEIRRQILTLDDAGERIDMLVEKGLDGVECYYSAFELHQCDALEVLTHSRGLAVSAGSDHHDYYRRNRLGRTAADGENYGERTNILEALGLSMPI